MSTRTELLASSKRVVRSLVEPRPIAGSPSWLLAGFALVLCWVSIGFAASTQVTMDDSFIVFRVVENWLAGLGPRFNAGDGHFIVTSPLWLVVLAACKGLLPNIATAALAQALVWVLLVAASVLLFALLRDDFPVASMLAPVAVFYTPSMPSLAGHDTACALVLGLALLVCHKRDHPNGLAIAAGLFYLARGEGAVLAGIVGCHYAFRTGFNWTSVRGQLYRMLPGLGISLACVAAWHVYYAFEFGGLFPATLATKIAQGSFQGNEVSDTVWPVFSAGLSDHFALIASNAVSQLLAIVGFGALVVRRGPLALWPLVHVMIYVGLGVPYYHWYYFPVELVGVVAVVVGVEVCVRLGQLAMPLVGSSVRFEIRPTPRLLAIAGAMVAIALIPCVRGPMLLQPGPMLPALRSVTVPGSPEIDARFAAYQEIAQWLRRRPGTPNEAMLASEIGILGHALPSLRLLDIVGLTDPAIPAERFFDYRWHIERWEPKYLLLFLGAAQVEQHTIRLSNGDAIQYRRVLSPKNRFRAAALFERVGRNP